MKAAWVGLFVVAGCADPPVPRAPSAHAPPVVPRAPSVRDSLAQMYQRYASAKTYEDRGSVVAVLSPDDGLDPHTTRVTFETVFNRETGAFRFEYLKKHDRFGSPSRQAIWRAGDGRAHTWWSIRAMPDEDELEDGLAAMAGVSDGTSHTVPMMLLRRAAGLSRGLGYAEDGEGMAGDVPCMKFSMRRQERVTTMWISKADHSLRRFTIRDHIAGVAAVPRSDEELARDFSDFPEDRRAAVIESLRKPHPFVVEQTVDYSPIFDQPIAASRFEFTPPN